MKVLIFLLNMMCVCNVYAMKLSLDREVPQDILIKIIACSEPRDRNALMRVNKHFRGLTAKTNTKILLHSPLLLGKKDREFYMMYHCDEGSLDVVHNLLRNGGNARQGNMLCIAPIALALQNKHYRVANLLRSHIKGDFSAAGTVSPVYIAVYKGDVERMNYYFNLGFVSIGGYPLLHMAVTKGHSAMVSLLIKRLKDFQKNADDGVTALHLAAKYGYAYIAQLLLPYFSVNQKCTAGNVALHWAVVEGHVNVVKLLLDCGAHINIQNNDGITALQMAAYHNHYDIVEMLLSRSVAINSRNKRGQTALDVAFERNSTEVIKLLYSNDCMARVSKPESRCKVVIRQVVSSSFFSFIAHQAITCLFEYVLRYDCKHDY